VHYDFAPSVCLSSVFKVRKHRAPKGAFRQLEQVVIDVLRICRQKAPSAKRCIKTAGV